MLLRKIGVIGLMVVLMGGCAMSTQKMNSVQLGMTKSEVIQALGEPNYTAARGDVEILSYRLSNWGLLTDDYIVQIRNGKVDLFGQRYDFVSTY